MEAGGAPPAPRPSLSLRPIISSCPSCTSPSLSSLTKNHAPFLLSDPFGAFAHEVRYSSPYATFISIFVVVFLVVWGKALFKKKGHKSSAFRGGALSGHAAVAFSLWTVVLFTQDNVFVVTVSFLLAALVAQSRLRAKIHSFWEVLAGALVGALVTALFFKIFR